jgi:hypothetical protein
MLITDYVAWKFRSGSLSRIWQIIAECTSMSVIIYYDKLAIINSDFAVF